jgi:hypothetical protein
MTALAGILHRAPKPVLPSPLVSRTRHPLKWTANTAKMVVAGVLVALLVGVPTIAALYYLVLETEIGIGHLGIYVHHVHQVNMTQLWHSLVPDSTERHTYRAVLEGFYGGLIGKAFAWNRYKKPKKKYKPLAAKRALLAVALAFLFAVPGFFLGEVIVHVFSHIIAVFSTSENVSTSTLGTIRDTLTGTLPKKIIGITAGFFFGHYAVLPVYDGIQRWFVERRIVLHKPLRFYHTPAFKARYNDLKAKGTITWQPSDKATAIMVTLTTLCLGLAGFGWYVLQVIAKQH